MHEVPVVPAAWLYFSECFGAVHNTALHRERKMRQPCPQSWSLVCWGVRSGLSLRFHCNLSLMRKGTKIDVSCPAFPPPTRLVMQKQKGKKNNKTCQALRGLTNKSPVGWGAIVLAWSAIPNKLRVV